VKLTHQITHKIILTLEHAAQSPLYIPFVGLLTAVDAFVPVIPNEIVLVSAVVAQPQSWFLVYISGTIGSALGAAVFSGLASRFGARFINKVFPHLINSKGWIDTTHYVQAKGFLGLSLVSLSPLPQHAAVAVAGMAHMAVMTVFWAVVLGRTPKYLAVCWASVYAKGALRKLKLLPSHGEAVADKIVEPFK
jgi:membrane protein YqaA with SNARE-associated domain